MSTVPEAFIANHEGPENAEPTPLLPRQNSNWQRELSQSIRSVDELLRRVGLNPDIVPRHSVAGIAIQNSAPLQDESRHGVSGHIAAQHELSRFPVLVPQSFLDRMKPGDPNDPLLRQVLPLGAESAKSDGFVTDAVGDLAARREAGVLQKYAGRVLLIATGACAVHCRYCFRREYPYADEPRRLEDWQPALDVISGDDTITEVIFSGGDPLMLSDSRLKTLCERIDAIPHVERIRFHTRLPIVLPSRITNELLSILSGLRAQPIMVVHANHANEIVGDCAQSLRTLVRCGVPVLNQAVLLRGINDTTDDQEQLNRRLINLGVMPYYLHQLDRVAGTSHFEVPVERGLQIINELAARLPGYAVPKYVQEIAGEPNKTMVIPRATNNET